ncbi:hypothetical protein FLGE108171_16000 [Flavobacterium gelidilacus]|uniref:hypothetical protein n=1 Tax=Flavobacterium gelidilacus TaxID=206041 RepID=UPI000478F6F9|nr:hypothetical protein [Flavobacterium gelidilacus]
MKKINYLQIILHLIATSFFIFSFQFFSAFYNVKVYNLTLEYGVENVFKNMEEYGVTVMDIWISNTMFAFSSSIAILVAFIISILISLRRKWSIWNSVIILVLSLISDQFDFFGIYHVKKYLSPSFYFSSNLFIYFLISGSFFLTIGLFVFFYKYFNEKIENQKQNLVKS